MWGYSFDKFALICETYGLKGSEISINGYLFSIEALGI